MKTWQQLLSIPNGVGLGFLLVAILMGGQPPALAAPGPAAGLGPASAHGCDSSRFVEVSGAATINVVPDKVLIKIGVESTDLTPERVQAENMAAIKKVIAAVRRLGVAEKDISTDRYIVYPVRRYDSLKVEGYRIDNVIAITLRDVNKTSDVLVAAFNAGANQVEDVQFYTSQLRRYRDEARTLAMRAATEKAQALAIAGGTQTGCLLHIDENTWSYYNGSWWGGRDRHLWSQNVVQNAAGDGQPGADESPISLGQIAIRAEVQATFSLR